MWNKFTERSAFQAGLDLPWEQDAVSAKGPGLNSNPRPAEPFVNYDLPLSAGLLEIESRLDELRKLTAITMEAGL
jgi:hypothetical protein